jgi:predicted dehydrogenase
MRYIAVFDKGTLDFDLTREHPLLLCGVDRAEPVMPFESHLSGYDRQTRAMLKAVATGDTAEIPSMTEAVAVARLLEAEEKSVRSGKTVAV